MNTSGCCVFAKTHDAAVALAAAFREQNVKKSYEALVAGITEPSFTVEARLDRDLTHKFRREVVSEGGQNGITHFNCKESFPDVRFPGVSTLRSEPYDVQGCSLVECIPKTGRTHQIRVHLTHIGHPIIGDDIYGILAGETCPITVMTRQALHASVLSFDHPRTREPLTFTAPWQDDMLAQLEQFRS
mmetsp:Transcript_21008/g.35047  ORF Transcript_21008/g.35047 Transcript_21008/m.35047 type:complete len:187 (-) Transcript_21008:154-714(-)